MEGKRVFVYRNMVRSTYAVRDLESGRVIDRDEVWLRNATFAVSQTGRLQALRQGRCILHAGIIGTFVMRPPVVPRCEMKVRYNPRWDSDFTDEDDHVVHKAPLVHLVNGRAYIPRQHTWL